MLKKSLWGVVLCSVASLGLLLTPGTSDAQRRGGGGGARGNWSGNRGWNGGGNWNNNWNRGWNGGWNRGWGWGGFGTGLALGYALGDGWGGYGGYGYSYPYYSGYSSYPYYGGYYGTPAYSYDYSYPSYTYGSPSYDQSTFATQQGYYGAANQQPANPNAVNLLVFVPDPNAQIWFENHQTQQQGTVRHFESTVQPGQTYNFHIKARMMQNGKPVDVTKDVQAQAGQRVMVNFGNAQQGNQAFQGSENLQQMPNNANVPFYGNEQQGYYGNNQFNTNPAVPENRQIENRSGTFNNQTERNLNQGNLNNQANQPGTTGNQTPANNNQNVTPNQGTGTHPGTTTNPAPGANTTPNTGTQGTNAGNNSQGGTQPGR